MKTLEHLVTFEKIHLISEGSKPMHVLVFILKEQPNRPLRVCSFTLLRLVRLYSDFLSLNYDEQVKTVKKWFEDGLISDIKKLDTDE